MNCLKVRQESPFKTGQRRDIPITDQSYVLACEVHCIIPVRTVQKLSPIVLQAWNCRPPPSVQDTAGVYQDVTCVLDDPAA